MNRFKPRNFIKVKLRWFLIVLFIFVSCNEQKKTDMGKWGIQSIEHEKKIEFRDSAYVEEIEFTPETSSDKYILRLFFPSIEIGSNSITTGDKTRDILEQLDGFEYSLFNLETGIRINTFSLSYPLNTRNYPFNLNDPLSLSMDSKLELSKENSYKIVMRIPSKRRSEINNIDPVVFVIGIGYSTYL